MCSTITFGLSYPVLLHWPTNNSNTHFVAVPIRRLISFALLYCVAYSWISIYLRDSPTVAEIAVPVAAVHLVQPQWSVHFYKIIAVTFWDYSDSTSAFLSKYSQQKYNKPKWTKPATMSVVVVPKKTTVNPDLANERKKCSFNTSEFTNWWYGGEKKVAEKRSRGEKMITTKGQLSQAEQRLSLGLPISRGISKECGTSRWNFGDWPTDCDYWVDSLQFKILSCHCNKRNFPFYNISCLCFTWSE